MIVARSDGVESCFRLDEPTGSVGPGSTRVTSKTRENQGGVDGYSHASNTPHRIQPFRYSRLV